MIPSLRSSPLGSWSSFPLQTYFSCKLLWATVDWKTMRAQFGVGGGVGWKKKRIPVWLTEHLLMQEVLCVCFNTMLAFSSNICSHTFKAGAEGKKKINENKKEAFRHLLKSISIQCRPSSHPLCTSSSIFKCNIEKQRFSLSKLWNAVQLVDLSFIYSAMTHKELFCSFALRAPSSRPIACRRSLEFDTAAPFALVYFQCQLDVQQRSLHL